MALVVSSVPAALLSGALLLWCAPPLLLSCLVLSCLVLSCLVLSSSGALLSGALLLWCSPVWCAPPLVHSCCRLTVELVQRAEHAGVSWISVHGRTVQQRTEPVSLEAIKLVCRCVCVCVCVCMRVNVTPHVLMYAAWVLAGSPFMCAHCITHLLCQGEGECVCPCGG